jgi:VanZ family protein
LQKAGFIWSFMFFTWFAIILFLALQTGAPSLNSSLLDWDKFQHAAAFGLLALLGGKALESWLPITRAWVVAFLLAVLLGGLVEIAQATLTNYRNGDWHDLLADTIGAALVSGTALLMHNRRKKITPFSPPKRQNPKEVQNTRNSS